MPRKLSVAVTTAAIPAVMMSALALAEPAAAAPVSPQNTLFPQLPLQAIKNLNTGAVTGVAASQLATQVPATLAAESSVPATHRIAAGDTVTSIAARYGLSVSEVLRVNNLQPTSLIFAGKELRLTGTAAAPAVPEKKAAPASGTYKVVSGDTLSAIAARHGVALSSILAANNLTLTSVIYPGQSIVVNGSTPSAPPAAPAAPAAPAPAEVQAAAGTYTVKPGDTLGAIAAEHGVSLSSVLAANGLNPSSVIRPGQQISVSGVGTVSIASSAPVAAAPTDAAPTDLVPSTFLHYTYPAHVVAGANLNKQTLNSLPVPSRAQMQQIVADTAAQMGVDPALAQAFALQESGFDQRAVSPANAIGTMQVIPSSGEWASQLVGRELNLLDPYDNATAGVAIISALIRTSDSLENAIASYYQGQYSVTTNGMFSDTRSYVSSVLAHRATFQ
ncbi:LysM peptidoglycan-binding domain-containing protein [Arthrobacter zhangbolii]|uniref:LysM peptidoglycan-binding domain-containing protein n=1 Tax=Arthrobacter zhangbolii TaxID=2886936 RepID=A0A9X1S8H2_9MICC|nr:lytic transglycosylase domain-containing protein [Arthrobacter zhangbolii]MCC3271918.1 LysM peptidoglycan-binding domain-containing protein [Arthrobacter zhangbolii]UON93264.1 LysM peptidoglycan-binding domain-containing protein [Arthrobacter zhangbolii]